MCIAPEAVMGMPICNTFIHSGLVPFHIHAVIPEERLHDLASNPPSLCFLFVLLFDTTPRSLSRRMPGQGSQSACLQRTGIIGIPPPPGSPGAALIAWSHIHGQDHVLQAVFAHPSRRFRSSRPDSQCNGLAGYEVINVRRTAYSRPFIQACMNHFFFCGLSYIQSPT